jgi:hypothetical protein
MLEYYLITKENIRDPKYLKLISEFVKDNDIKRLATLARMFYRADIWV